MKNLSLVLLMAAGLLNYSNTPVVKTKEQEGVSDHSTITTSVQVEGALKGTKFDIYLPPEDEQTFRAALQKQGAEEYEFIIDVIKPDIIVSPTIIDGKRYIEIKAYGVTRYMEWKYRGRNTLDGRWRFILDEIIIARLSRELESNKKIGYWQVDSKGIVRIDHNYRTRSISRYRPHSGGSRVRGYVIPPSKSGGGRK